MGRHRRKGGSGAGTEVPGHPNSGPRPRSHTSGRSEHAALPQADEAAGFADHDVIQDFDAEELAGGGKATGQGAVVGRRFRVAGYGEFPVTGVRRTSALCGRRCSRPCGFLLSRAVAQGLTADKSA
jgi:hypothetical protein